MANAIIDDIVRREILVKTSVQQRGPGVEYGPGPKFPHRARASRKRRGSKADGATLWDESEP
jgi:ATP-dependent DNA helicase RecG